MNILFVCPGAKGCRSLIAHAIMKSKDSNLKVFFCGIHSFEMPGEAVKQIFSDLELRMERNDEIPYQRLSEMEFDFLITIYDGASEKLEKLPLKYGHKLHLDFADPEKPTARFETKLQAYMHLKDELQSELDYFYHKMLKDNQLAGQI